MNRCEYINGVLDSLIGLRTTVKARKKNNIRSCFGNLPHPAAVSLSRIMNVCLFVLYICLGFLGLFTLFVQIVVANEKKNSGFRIEIGSKQGVSVFVRYRTTDGNDEKWIRTYP